MASAKFAHAQAMAKRRRRRRRSASGFTLIEVLVALGILALSASAVFAAISNGLRDVRQADAGARAGLLARSLLARVGADIPLREGETEGQFAQGVRWRLRLLPFGDAGDRRLWPVAAYTVRAEVSWRDAGQMRSITIETLHLGPKVPEK
jgi:general secretion pathway protein I